MERGGGAVVGLAARKTTSAAEELRLQLKLDESRAPPPPLLLLFLFLSVTVTPIILTVYPSCTLGLIISPPPPHQPLHLRVFCIATPAPTPPSISPLATLIGTNQFPKTLIATKTPRNTLPPDCSAVRLEKLWLR